MFVYLGDMTQDLGRTQGHLCLGSWIKSLQFFSLLCSLHLDSSLPGLFSGKRQRNLLQQITPVTWAKVTEVLQFWISLEYWEENTRTCYQGFLICISTHLLQHRWTLNEPCSPNCLYFMALFHQIHVSVSFLGHSGRRKGGVVTTVPNEVQTWFL